MTLPFPAPTVEGVVDGKLNVNKFPTPTISVNYEPINKPHTISVIWEIYGPDRSVYCCVLASQPANSSSLQIKAWDEYTAFRSPRCNIRVRYSVSIDGDDLQYSENLEFYGEADGGTVGTSNPDLAVREAIAQYPSGHYVAAIDLNTDTIGDYVTLYATWATMGSRERCIIWKEQDAGNYLWQSEYKKAEADSAGELRPVIFQMPKDELLKLNGGYGVLALREREGGTARVLTMFASVNYVDSKGAGTAWPPEPGATKLTPESQRG